MNPGPGEEIAISGIADPNEEVRLHSSFQMDLPVLGGRYEYETSVEIPQKPNRFTVTARNVKDLSAGVKMVIWITKRFEASGGVATVSQSDVHREDTPEDVRRGISWAAIVPVRWSRPQFWPIQRQYSLAIDQRCRGLPHRGDGDQYHSHQVPFCGCNLC
jgi:hypothetical protein